MQNTSSPMLNRINPVASTAMSEKLFVNCSQILKRNHWCDRANFSASFEQTGQLQASVLSQKSVSKQEG